ncbi:MAG: hypothetical protein P8Z76_21235 [Alphaproteobacteria bacterium]
MRHLQRRLDRLEGSGGSDGMFIVPLYHGDEDHYPPERLTTVKVRDPNKPHRMMTLPGLIIFRNSEVPQLLEGMAGRSRLVPGS